MNQAEDPVVLLTSELPDRYYCGNRTDLEKVLQLLMPGYWNPTTITKRALAYDEVLRSARLECHATQKEDVHRLVRAINWEAIVAPVMDCWCGTGTIRTVLEQQGVPVVQNDLDCMVDADYHWDSLAITTWSKWKAEGVAGVVVTSPWFGMLDVAMPLMSVYAEVVLVHVPGHWLFNLTVKPREHWLKELQRQGRLCIIPNLPSQSAGIWRCAWICIFRTRQDRQRIMRDGHRLQDLIF